MPEFKAGLHQITLEQKLKPLFIDKFTISDTFMFARQLKDLSLNENDILVSYDVALSLVASALAEYQQLFGCL